MRVPGAHPVAEQITPLPSLTRAREGGREGGKRGHCRLTMGRSHCGGGCQGGRQTKMAAVAAAAMALVLVAAHPTGKLTGDCGTSAEFDGPLSQK